MKPYKEIFLIRDTLKPNEKREKNLPSIRMVPWV
jgi:hypothetical protein